MDFTEAYVENSSTTTLDSVYPANGGHKIIPHPVASAIWRYALPVIGCLGAFGNLTSFAIMLTRKMRTTSYSVYIAALAILDTLNLSCLMAMQYFGDVMGLEPPGLLNKCNFKRWFLAASSAGAAWVVIAMTCERLIAIYRPIKSRMNFTVKRAAIITICLVIIPYVVYIPTVLAFSQGQKCWGNNEDARSLVDWPWYNDIGYFSLNALTHSIVPSFLLVGINTAIFVGLTRQSKPKLSTNFQIADKRRDSRYKETGIMVLTASMIYATFTLPTALAVIYNTVTGKGHYNALIADPGQAIMVLLYDMNFCANFYLYVVVVPSFRKSAVAMFANFCNLKATRKSSYVPKPVETSNSGISHIV